MKYFNCVAEKLWLTISDVCAEQLRDGMKLVFSPDITLVLDWAENTS